MFIYHLDSGCQNQMGMMGGRKEKRRQENCSTLSLLACVRTYVSTLTLTHTGGITITTFSNGNAYNFVLLPINAKQTDNTISSFYSLCVSTHTLFFCVPLLFLLLCLWIETDVYIARYLFTLMVLFIANYYYYLYVFVVPTFTQYRASFSPFRSTHNTRVK